MLLEKLKQPRVYLGFVTILLSISGFVVIEPAPYDVLWLVVCLLGICSGYLTFPKRLWLPLGLAIAFMAINFAAIPGAPSVLASLRYALITLYLFLSWLYFIGLVERLQIHAVTAIARGYAVAAVLSVALSLVGLSGLTPLSDLFVYGGVRAQGLFKDPNVFGPFLVPVVLFGWHQASASHDGQPRLAWIGLSALAVTGVLLSMSRGAWLNLALAGLVYFALPQSISYSRKLTAGLLAGLIALGLMVYPLSNPAVRSIFFSRFALQSYDRDRFSTQAKALGISEGTGNPPAVPGDTSADPESSTSQGREENPVPGDSASNPGPSTPEGFDDKKASPGGSISELEPATSEGRVEDSVVPVGGSELPTSGNESEGSAIEDLGQQHSAWTPHKRNLLIGWGPGQANIVLGMATHSLYIRAFVEHGYLGALVLFLLIMVTVIRVTGLALTAPGWQQGFFAVVAACLVGALANSVVIDSIHWRHLWLLMGLAWAPKVTPSPDLDPQPVVLGHSLQQD